MRPLDLLNSRDCQGTLYRCPILNGERIPPHPTLTTFYRDDSERQRFINGLFDRGAADYDRVNHLLSLGTGYWYRGEVLRRAGLREGMRVLDVATGTGPVAAAAREIVGASGLVVGADPSIGMLDVARRKRTSSLTAALGESLPFRNAAFEMVTMGYALRHVSDLRAAFAEYRRVLTPAGRLVVMEIALSRSRPVALLQRLFMNTLAPRVARGSDSRQMMRYYWATTESCVAPEVILSAMRAAGFADVHRIVRYGVMAEYHGTRP